MAVAELNTRLDDKLRDRDVGPPETPLAPVPHSSRTVPFVSKGLRRLFMMRLDGEGENNDIVGK